MLTSWAASSHKVNLSKLILEGPRATSPYVLRVVLRREFPISLGKLSHSHLSLSLWEPLEEHLSGRKLQMQGRDPTPEDLLLTRGIRGNGHINALPLAWDLQVTGLVSE